MKSKLCQGLKHSSKVFFWSGEYLTMFALLQKFEIFVSKTKKLKDSLGIVQNKQLYGLHISPNIVSTVK